MKKKFVSMLLALALVVTGVPSGMTADTAYAAEVSEKRTVFSDGAEETGSVPEQNNASEEALHSEAGDLHAFNVAENGKAVGSDGVAYTDVVYLSASSVEALGAEGQDAYVEICDRIAEEKKAGDCMETAVIAVDAEGNLFVRREVPVNVLADSLENLTEDFSKEPVALQQDDKIESDVQPVREDEELSTEESVEEKTLTEDLEDEENVKEADSDNGNATDETEAEQITEAEPSIDETVSADEEIPTATEDFAEADSEQESSVDETVAVEESLTEEGDAVTDELVLTAENMDLIGGYDTESFEIVDNAKADIQIDLGYGNASDVLQFNSILPQKDWFSKQLSKNQTTIYNACKVMGKGTNTFTFGAASLPREDDICQAISAYIMTEPYKCDWMDLTKNPQIIDYYLVDSSGKKTYNKKTSVTIPKSKYYTAAIQKDANAKVQQLAVQAQEYAIENYPNSPVYGIVKYFDKWICEENYYNNIGTLEKIPEDDKEKQEIYYYCHSSYGILLKGYGVCESYALSMTRLLDSVGIPNMYATGLVPADTQSGVGGHAWNYVQMPDGKWYLHDSTWNDDEALGGSTEKFLVGADDGYHLPVGNRYIYGTNAFEFVTPSKTEYHPERESIVLSETELNLQPKKTAELTYKSEYISNDNIPKVWSSSDEKVAKVDKNGKVTAVAPGSAEIAFSSAGMTAVCKVNVHQINSITFDDSGKVSLTASGAIVGGKGEKQSISLTVNQKAQNPVCTAEELKKQGVFEDFGAESSDKSVATVSSEIAGDQILLDITPIKAGKTKITVVFGAKKATLNYTVGEKLDESWFDLKEVKELQENTNLMYTGKAYKPKVVLSQAGKDKKVKFKTVYKNNKDAGTASVVITGSGAYGGELVYNFTIKPLALKVDANSIKVKKTSNVYNGGDNQASITAKHINDAGKGVGLKAGKDYYIEYKDEKGNTTKNPTEVGKYTMKIVGKVNYLGEYAVPGTYEITPNDIQKVKVAVKVNGTKPVVTVAIGKNELSKQDYKMTYYTDKECTKAIKGLVFLSKTQYFVKVEAAGSNLTDMKQKPIVKSFKTK